MQRGWRGGEGKIFDEKWVKKWTFHLLLVLVLGRDCDDTWCGEDSDS